MAIRSGGGTGVLVALVVFVIMTVCFLVMTIVFYAGKNTETQKFNEADATLKTFVTSAQQQDETLKAAKAAAATERESLYGYMVNQRLQLAQVIGGAPSADAKALQLELGLKDGETAKAAIADLRRQFRSKDDEVKSLTGRIGELNRQLTDLKDSLEAEKANGQKLAEAMRTEFAGYDTAAKDLISKLEEARTSMQSDMETLKQSHQARVDELQGEIDSLRASTAVIQSRNDVLMKKLEAIELKPANPAELVDGRVIAIEGSGDQVFINIGAADRVVPGMTFEIFDDANAIAASEKTGRGKASIQVLRVAESTSTCKIIRQSTGRPVVKDDVIANAVFNPEYRFKFLVHGKFDVDGDGRPSDTEAEYLRSRIKEWGGELVDGDNLVGDLDFLVLGVQPPMPAPLPDNPAEAQLQAAIEARTARETYDNLLRDAIEARIPVLNWNRFQVLTGSVAGR
jgi:polyhydroxyalkanoate synthesis regulator phasin